MELRQATATTLKIGPFLDSTNGNDEEIALTINQADVKLSKNGGAFAQKNDAVACTHDANGMYFCPINVTDTGTLGRLQLICHVAGALFVWHDFMVITQEEYDALGANAVTITLKDTDTNGVIIPDVFVTLRNNTDDTVLDRKITNENGQVIFSLNNGSYKLYIRKLGNYTFTIPEALTVLGDTVKEYYGDPFSPSAPSAPNTCIIYGWVIDANGQAKIGITVKAMIAIPPQLSAEQYAILTEEVLATTGIDGYFEIILLREEEYYLVIPEVSYAQKIEVPAQASVNYALL